uniref:Uncharacterized protein n=1 Tax=Anguilla anguilla TaxID=7936 RepID=A0A0E9XIR5_ANGAN
MFCLQQFPERRPDIKCSAEACTHLASLFKMLKAHWQICVDNRLCDVMSFSAVLKR